MTGASSGIGAGIAVAFAREGADVALVDRSGPAAAAGVVAAVEAHGRRAVFVEADVADEADVAAMADAALAALGRVDVLVNNAGIFTQGLVEELPVADWDRVVAVNLRGPFLCSRALLPQMLARGDGRIINVASQLGQIGGVEVAHYAASKAGLIGLTKSLAREVAGRGVLVNAIAPGPVQTPLLDGETEAWRSAKLAELPIGRFARGGRDHPDRGAARLRRRLLLRRPDPRAQRRGRDAVTAPGRCRCRGAGAPARPASSWSGSSTATCPGSPGPRPSPCRRSRASWSRGSA